MLHLKRNVSIYLMANILVSMIPFLMMPVLTRYLGTDGYGIVAMYITLIVLLSPIVGCNVHNGLSKRWFEREQFCIPEYLSACLIILIFSALFVGLILWSVEEWLCSKLSLTTFWLYMALVVSVCSFIIQMRLALWQVQEKPFKYGSIQFASAFFNATLTYGLIVLMHQSFEGRLWGHSLAFILIALWSLFLLFKEGLIVASIRWDYIKDALAFGLPLAPHVLGAFFLFMADRMIVNVMLGSHSAGIYMVAAQIALGFNLVNESFNKAFLPRLFASLHSGHLLEKIYIVKLTYVYFAFLLLVPLFFIILGPYLVFALAGNSFQEAAPVLNWLMLTQSFHGMYYLVTNYLFYERKTYITSTVTFVCGLISITATVTLVHYLGLIGAGIGSAIGMLFQFLLTWLMAARVHPMPWFSFVGVQRQGIRCSLDVAQRNQGTLD